MNWIYFDYLGRKIKTFDYGKMRTGDYKFFWDGTDEQGKKVGPGIYFVLLKQDNNKITKK